MILVAFNCFIAFSSSLVWGLFFYLSVRERRVAWSVLTGLAAFSLAWVGAVYFMALAGDISHASTASRIRPVASFVMGLPALIGYGMIREMNRTALKFLQEATRQQLLDSEEGDT